MSLKLVCINIERSKHLDRVLPFIERERPDVLCLQEVVERDIDALMSAAGAHSSVFAPDTMHPAETELALTGAALFSRLTPRVTSTLYYRGSRETVHPIARTATGDPIDPDSDMNRALVIGEFEQEDALYSIATTHFTWSAHGEPTDAQRTDLQRMLELLESYPEVVLCGDFNAPRLHRGAPGEIFSKLTERFTDNIPPQYLTSIDVTLHRAGRLPGERMDEKMVDGLFTTPSYLASDVRLVEGISDHMAIVATIDKKSA